MNFSHVLLVLFLSQFLAEVNSIKFPGAVGLICKQHPLYTAGIIPVLMRSYVIPPSRASQSAYRPRYDLHRFVPLKDRTSTKYANLDWFFFPRTYDITERHAKVFLQRPAKLYMVVQHRHTREYPAMKLPGWRPEGYATLSKGLGKKFVFGVHQKVYKDVSERAYVFSKNVGTTFYLPSGNWVARNTKGLEVIPDFWILMAEADGSASKAPRQRAGTKTIVPNERCPEWVHNSWVTPDDDEHDADTKGKKWPTWHPMWDPCYWCAYDHEHGSSPNHLMNYNVKFGYAAYKNNREDESHEGFKGIVFRYKTYFVYYMLHAQTSSLRRISQSIHTILIVITNASTGEKLVELTHKADFGFIGARLPSGGFFPLTRPDQTLMNALEKTGPRRSRSVNVIDVGNLDPRFAYRMPRELLMKGVYEDWTTAANLCVQTSKQTGSFSVDFIAAASGIRSLRRKDVKVNLGTMLSDKFFRQTGAPRRFFAFTIPIGAKHCRWKLEDIHGGRSRAGYFYTDASGGVLEAGPGEKHVRQFAKPGFETVLEGQYEAVESWTGLYVRGAKGHLEDYEYGLDPDLN